jgi:hypothetical protein
MLATKRTTTMFRKARAAIWLPLALTSTACDPMGGDPNPQDMLAQESDALTVTVPVEAAGTDM